MIENIKKVLVENNVNKDSKITKTDKFVDSIILDFILNNINDTNLPLKTFINRFEERIIITSLILSNGNQKVAASLLGVRQTTLFEKIKKYNLKKKYLEIDILKNITRDFKNILDS